MSNYVVSRVESWGPPIPAGDFALLDHGGKVGNKFALEDAEVVLTGERPDGKFLVLPLSFATEDQAERAGELLRETLAQVGAISRETPAEPNDGHEHDFGLYRFGRTSPQVRCCRLCSYHEELDEPPAT